MIKCLAIDDEPLALRQLVSYIEKTPYLELVSACNSALDAKDIIDRQSIDAIFVDINMPDLNGLDFVRQLSKPLLVVFTTAYSEYAIEGYKVDAIDYLLKPFGLEDFQRAAQKVKTQYELLQKANTEDLLYLKMDYKVVRLNIKEIRYVEGMSKYLKIHTEKEARPLVVLMSMKKLEERLPKEAFMRVHKSYIVNLQKIKEVARGKILMNAPLSLGEKVREDEQIPIGYNYKEQFKSYLDKKFITK